MLNTGHALNYGHKVLSNNDGCVIALSSEAKALGYRMGDPWFKVELRAAAQGVIARSSNYELYGDISNRVMNRRLLCEMQLAIIL
ncbi:DNA polymerase V subunit UmuC [Mycobacteroides abscessus subsp. bolletii]|nr:DNA polymerase V subunit UmuC [Mycobacteroides abscessus subsp. bolletii]